MLPQPRRTHGAHHQADYEESFARRLPGVGEAGGGAVEWREQKSAGERLGHVLQCGVGERLGHVL